MLVLGLALTCAGLLFLLLARGLWFFGDEWSFLLHRRVTLRGSASVLEPHNEHWTTIPLLVYRLMYAVFGLHHFMAYAVLPVVLHLLVCVLLYLRLRGSGVSAWTGVLATVVLAFLGTGAENVLWPFQIAFLGSAAAGLVALLAIDDRTPDRGSGRGRMLAVWVGLTVALMCSGMALPMVVWVGCLALLTRGVAVALVATLPPTVLYLAWFVTYGQDASAQAPRADLGQLAGFLRVGLGQVWQTPGLPAVGLVVLAALAGFAFLGPVEPPLRALAVSGVVTTVATYVMLGVGRAGLGEDAALAGRYVYFGALFTLPAFAAFVTSASRWLGDRRRERVVLGILVAALFVVSGTAQAVVFATDRSRLVGDLPERTSAAVELIESGSPLLSTQPEPLYAETLDVASLSRSSVQRALPRTQPGPQARWDARAALLVGASAVALDLPVAAAVTEEKGLLDETTSGSCASGRAAEGARIVVTAGADGVQLRITQAGPTYTTILTSASGLRSASIVRKVEPHVARWVGTSAPDADLTVILRAGAFAYCLAEPPR